MMILEYSGWTALFLLKRILIKSLLKNIFIISYVAKELSLLDTFEVCILNS